MGPAPPNLSSAYLKYYFTSGVVLEESGKTPENAAYQKNLIYYTHMQSANIVTFRKSHVI